MTAAAISAQLVDIRNVGTHKVVKLTLHAPEEHAMAIMEAFGWPTMVAPVPVALAKLDPNRKEAMPPDRPKESSRQSDTPPRPSVVPASADGADKCVSFHRGGSHCVNHCAQPRDCSGQPLPLKKSPAQIAGYLCTLPSFHKFLRERFTDQWVPNAEPGRNPENVAKETLYDICAVTSRTQLTKENIEWHALQLAFRLWENHPELEDA